MPTRQEVFEALRNLAEEVMTSLRMLLTLIFTLTTTISPQDAMAEEQAEPIQRLIIEVGQQRMKIEELANLMSTSPPATNNNMPGRNNPMSPVTYPMHNQVNQAQGQVQMPVSTMPGPSSSPGEPSGSEDWELAEMQEFARQVRQPGNSSQGPSSSQAMPMRNLPMTRIQAPVMPGPPPVNIEPAPAATSQQVAIPQQVVLTGEALERWGRKKITWGTKHKGKLYRAVFDSDPGYTEWVHARMDTVGELIADYGNYATTRMRLEQ